MPHIQRVVQLANPQHCESNFLRVLWRVLHLQWEALPLGLKQTALECDDQIHKLPHRLREWMHFTQDVFYRTHLGMLGSTNEERLGRVFALLEWITSKATPGSMATKDMVLPMSPVSIHMWHCICHSVCTHVPHSVMCDILANYNNLMCHTV